jgi:hypothetical protein
MLLKLIKTNRNASFLLFPVIVLGIWLSHLKSPQSFPFAEGVDDYILFGLIDSLLADRLLVKILIAAFLMLINGFFIFRLYREYLFPSSWSMLPAILFVILTGGLPGYEAFHPVWFAIFFLLMGINRLFATFDLHKPYRHTFEAGFFLGIGSLFYFNLLVMLPALIIGSQMIVRDARWREPFHVFFGALVPWLLVFSFYFIVDKTDVLLHSLATNFLIPGESIVKEIPLQIYLGFLVLLTLAGSYTMLKQYAVKKVKFRQYYVFFFLLFLSALISLILVPAISSEMLIIAAVPTTFLLSNYFEGIKHILFGEIVFMLLIGLVVYFQFFPL